MIDTPRITQSPARQIACIPLTVPREEIRNVMGPGYKELMAALAAQGIAPGGPWFNYHRKIDSDVFDLEISIPVASPVTAVGRVKPGELRAATVARTVYHGPYEGLPGAWSEFDAWIKANRHKPAPDLWEFYAIGPESGSDPSQWQTELNRPLIV